MEIEENESMDVKENEDLSSSSSDDEDNEELVKEAETLEAQLATNKYLYDNYVKLVKLYEQIGDLESLRAAYRQFYQVFPLTSELWLNWLQIECKLAISDDDVKKVFELFDKAVEDYLSVNLWLEYARYALNVSSMEKTKEILGRALNCAGLHAKDGSLLWDFLREIELAKLSTLTPGSDERNDQISKVVETFRRQLSVPLLDMENTYAEWGQWIKSLDNLAIDTKQLEWGYKNALDKLSVIKQYENDLLDAKIKGEAELLESYKNYISKTKDPSTVVCLYERAVSDLCLYSDLWSDYCDFVLKLGEPALRVSSRALRNCTWSEDLWVKKLRIMENLSSDGKEILNCFENGLTSIAPSPGVQLWLAYLEYVNRNENDKVYKLFDQAFNTIDPEVDQYYNIGRFYARVLSKAGKMKETRVVWNKIIGIPQNKASLTMWLEYLSLERQHGEPKQLRSLYQRAIGSCKEWSHYLAQEWLLYERECGGLEDVIKCVEKCKDVPTAPPPQTDDVRPKKRKHENEVPKDIKKTKREEPEPRRPISKDPSTTVFVSNILPSVTEKTLKTMFPNALNVHVIHDRNKRGKCYAYVQFSMEEEVMHALARDREPLDGRPVFISSCKTERTERQPVFKYSTTVEENKLFVRGLPIPTSESELMELFSPYGAKAVRLVLHRSGKQKGLAYVEFADPESTKKALAATDGAKVRDQEITVAISAPPPKKSRDEPLAEPVRHSRSRLGVSLVPRSVQIKKEDSRNGTASKSNEDFRKMLLKK